MVKKDQDKILQEKLLVNRDSSWLITKDEKNIFKFAEDYKIFLDNTKTERKSVSYIIKKLVKSGFKDFNKITALKTGDKFYSNIKNKALIAGIVGKNKEMIHLIGSHIDSPRLDLKPHPLYEDSELALMQTHYYGGIKKYHWVNTPLALHGLIITKNKTIELNLGENPQDPIFMISDLLPHLSSRQMKKEARDIIEGEELNIIVGHIPIKNKEVKTKIKLAVLKYLYETYGIIEEDFNCAELELVPANKARDVGFDKGLVAAYGQDDSVCVYTSMEALLKTKTPLQTALCFFADKEEIGSHGNTGATSNILINFAVDYVEKAKLKITATKLLEHSKAISADVTAGMDPNFKDVHDPENVSYLGRGIAIEKYGGGGGKYGTNDASAEYMDYLRKMLNKNNIKWQTGELGKIDLGGGGTIAMYLSRYGMDCVDAGPAVLGMHSTYEITSKIDVYSAFQFYKVFFEN
jgi:aspartyl aminopeptidase